MKAWILDESPGSYRFGEIAIPDPSSDEVRIRVTASALNHMDLWVTRGMPKPPLPHVPGCDAVGIVESVGSDVTSVSVGDEVVVNPAVSSVDDIVKYGNDSPLGPSFQIWGEHTWGGHAEYALVPARNVRPRPLHRTLEECAAFPLASLTALRMLNRARLRPGTTVLVVGIGSGVSCAALSISKFSGAHVIATSRDARKRDAALALGADEVIDTSAEKWNVQADIVVESVGPATWDKSVRSLAPGGRLVVCGGTSGSVVEINLPRLFFKQFEIIGSSMGSYEEFDQLLALMDDGLPVQVDAVHALDDYATALGHLESSQQLGKIVLRH
jgi:NADPH:quinone reductase-like Zn-dependent oxidoreductase